MDSLSALRKKSRRGSGFPLAGAPLCFRYCIPDR